MQARSVARYRCQPRVHAAPGPDVTIMRIDNEYAAPASRIAFAFQRHRLIAPRFRGMDSCDEEHTQHRPGGNQ